MATSSPGLPPKKTAGPVTGSITGIVKSSSGSTISGAHVGYGVRTVTSVQHGEYTLTDVPPGMVHLRASANGFQDGLQSVNVIAGVVPTVAHFTLTPRAATAETPAHSGQDTLKEVLGHLKDVPFIAAFTEALIILVLTHPKNIWSISAAIIAILIFLVGLFRIESDGLRQLWARGVPTLAGLWICFAFFREKLPFFTSKDIAYELVYGLLIPAVLFLIWRSLRIPGIRTGLIHYLVLLLSVCSLGVFLYLQGIDSHLTRVQIGQCIGLYMLLCLPLLLRAGRISVFRTARAWAVVDCACWIACGVLTLAFIYSLHQESLPECSGSALPDARWVLHRPKLFSSDYDLELATKLMQIRGSDQPPGCRKGGKTFVSDPTDKGNILRIEEHDSRTLGTIGNHDACELRWAELGDMSAPEGMERHVIGLSAIAIIVNKIPAELSIQELQGTLLYGKPAWQVYATPGDHVEIFLKLLLGPARAGHDVTQLRDGQAVYEAVAKDRGSVGVLDYTDAKKLIKPSGPVQIASFSNPEPKRPAIKLEKSTILNGQYPLRYQLVLDVPRDSKLEQNSKKIELPTPDGVAKRDEVSVPTDDEDQRVCKEVNHDDRLLNNIFIQFKPREFSIPAETYERIETLKSELAGGAFKQRTLLVLGFADERGGIDYNKDLSERRALMVQEALTNAYGQDSFVYKGSIIAKGMGSKCAVDRHFDEAAREKNRRVEIWVRRY